MFSLSHRAKALVLSGMLGAVACSGDQKSTVAPKPNGPDPEIRYVVSITPKRDTLPVGLSRILSARVADAAGATQNVTVEWSSLNPQVASVSAGTVTAFSAGTAAIVARFGVAADTAELVVTAEAVHLQLSPSAISASLGDTVTFSAQLVTASGKAMSTPVTNWSASDSAAVLLMDGGRAALTNVGDAQVTARVGDMSASASVNVFASAVGSLVISPSTASITVGATSDLDAKVYDKNGRQLYFRSVTWTSSDASIATVNGSGTVRGIARGGVIITATSGGKSSTATVNVSSQPASSVSLTISPNPIVATAKVQAVATPKDASGNPVTGRPIAYQSSNPSVATIDASGLITGIIAGSTNISAICDGHVATVKLNVEDQHVASIAIVPGAPSVKQGSTATLVADVKDQMGNDMPSATVSWSSLNPAVAPISSGGVVSGISIGTTSVKATSGAISATATVTVTSQGVASVSLTPTTGTIQSTKTTQLSATALDASGHPISGASFTWDTGNANVATVSSLGVVTGRNPGSTMITATSSGKYTSASITVTSVPPAPVAAVTVTLNAGSLNIGQTTQAVATLTDAQGNVLTGRTITWTSATPSVATVSASGLVTAVAPGTASITATSEGIAGNASVTVNTPPVSPVASVTVSAASTTLQVGQSSQLTVVLKDAQGQVLSGRSIAYASSNTAVATVSASGLVSGLAAGSATMSVTSEGVTGTLAMTVQSSAPPPPTAYSVTVTVNAGSLQVGQTTQATAVVKDVSGNVIPGATVTWATSNPAVATVNSSGLVSAVGAGIVAISASTSGLTGSAAVSVTAPPPVVSTVTVTMSSSTLNVGQSLQATAVAKDASGNLMGGVTFTWSVSSTSVLGVSASGLVTGVANGTAQVKATASGVTGSLSVTVQSPAPPPGPNGLTAPPALPQVYLNFPYTPATGSTIYVAAGANLQNAINSAQRGDEIVLQAGATFTGNFTLPLKSGPLSNGWVTIRGDKFNLLPAEGTRVTSANASLMPKIVTNNSAPALATQLSASGYRLVGLEVTISAAYTGPQYGIVWLGDGSSAQNTLAKVATDLVLDRMYIHGQTGSDVSRCVALNSARTAITDSYLSECHGKGYDAQAILGYNGPGPYKIVNNTLIGSTENVMFGGADPWLPNNIPSDIEIRQNYFYTPPSWKGVWLKKNLFELKAGQRILVEGNVFDGSWQDGQTGWALHLKVENQSGGCTWCTTSDLTIRYNLIRNAGGGIAIAGREGNSPYPATHLLARASVQNNIVENINVGQFTGDNRLAQVLGNPSDVEFVNNTMTSTGYLGTFLFMDLYPTATRLVWNRNVSSIATYGMLATGRGEGTPALAAVAGGWQFNNNYLIGSARSNYPATTTFVSSISGVPAGYGADQATVNAKTAGVIIP